MKTIIAALFFMLSIMSGIAQTSTSPASVTVTVTAIAAVPAKVSLAFSPAAPTFGQTITYTGRVTGSNNGATPTGTVTVVGITGTQTVTLGSGGVFACSETANMTGTFTVTATYSGDKNFLP